jgi:hypothetical protein
MADHKTPTRLALLSFISVALFLPPGSTRAQSPSKTPPSKIYLRDDSDWWSIARAFPSGGAKAQDREPPPGSLEILGIDLDKGILPRAIEKLGMTAIVGRGDGGKSRDQVCYVSTEEGAKTYLIFENNEIDNTFYLFGGGPAWNGSDKCLRNALVNRKLATASGLQLEQTPEQVITILGKPSEQRAGELIYLFETKGKGSPEELKKHRQDHPQMTEKEFQDSFGTYDLSAMILLKFVDEKLTYLTASMSKTY